jgi:DNA-binding XRE family transcriptional regulator
VDMVTSGARPGRAFRAEPLPVEVRTMLGSRLRVLREDRGLSLQDLARRVGMSRGSIGDLERGDVLNPSLSTVLRLMSALDLPSIELLFGDPEYVSGKLARAVGRQPLTSGGSHGGRGRSTR